MEYALIGLIVAVALLFMVRRVFKALAKGDSGCGCGCGSSCPSNTNNTPGKIGSGDKTDLGSGPGPSCRGCSGHLAASQKGLEPIPFFAHSNENDNQLQGKE